MSLYGQNELNVHLPVILDEAERATTVESLEARYYDMYLAAQDDVRGAHGGESHVTQAQMSPRERDLMRNASRNLVEHCVTAA